MKQVVYHLPQYQAGAIFLDSLTLDDVEKIDFCLFLSFLFDSISPKLRNFLRPGTTHNFPYISGSGKNAPDLWQAQIIHRHQQGINVDSKPNI